MPLIGSPLLLHLDHGFLILKVSPFLVEFKEVLLPLLHQVQEVRVSVVMSGRRISIVIEVIAFIPVGLSLSLGLLLIQRLDVHIGFSHLL